MTYKFLRGDFFTILLIIIISLISLFLLLFFIYGNKRFRNDKYSSSVKKKSKKKVSSLKPGNDLLADFRMDLLNSNEKNKINDVIDDDNNNTVIYDQEIGDSFSEFKDINLKENVQVDLKGEISRPSSEQSIVGIDNKNNNGNILKCSRNKKKRLKAKLKINNFKFQNLHQNVISGSNVKHVIGKLEDSSVKSYDYLENNTSLHSTPSSEFSNKLQSCQSLENLFISERLEAEVEENLYGDVYNSYDRDYIASDYEHDERDERDQQIEDLKAEKHKLIQNINLLSPLSIEVNDLKKRNECLEQTFNAVTKELTTTIQKNLSANRELGRYKLERNREMNNLNNTINILENDIIARRADQENMRNNLEKIHELLSEKDKLIQHQTIEVYSLKQQLLQNNVDNQDLESQIKKSTEKLKEVENQMQLANEESQKVIAEMEVLKAVKNETQSDFDNFKMQSRKREREQDTLLRSFQYQIDELFRENQQLLMNNSNGDVEDCSEILDNRNIADNNVITDIQSCERETIKKLPSLFVFQQSQLQDLKDNEINLIEQNKNLQIKSESQLAEILALKTNSENLKLELLKYSDVSFETIQLQLKEKSQTLLETEDSLAKFKLSLNDTNNKWLDTHSEMKQENFQLKNDLTIQASLVFNQNKKISELTNLLQAYNNSQNEQLYMDSSLDGFSETFNQR